MSKPVILLAFANETPESRTYLRNLRRELNQLVQVFEKAEEFGLCELKVMTNATLDNLFDAFQNKRLRNRIAIFHFAGHANSYQLLLETDQGEAQAAFADGLVPFLGSQPSLKLVFLNGCYSAIQAKELIQHGIPAVVGTIGAVRDSIASELATQFYKGITAGIGIDSSWKEAVLKVRAQSGDKNLDSFFQDNDQNNSNRGMGFGRAHNQFPWEIHYKPGKETIKLWNLPEAAGDPYFGLPQPTITTHLPDLPYRFLARFEKNDHPIFFGRGRQIRDLYMRLTSPHSSPVVFLFGQSGVGKSSLLDAGLLPRLEVEHEVRYVRRNKEQGLLSQFIQVLDGIRPPGEKPIADRNLSIKSLSDDIKQLQQAISTLEGNAKSQLQQLIDQLQNQKATIEQSTIDIEIDLRQKWLEIERNHDKNGLIIILDQVEEVFTQPNPYLPHELEDLFYQLASIFNKPNALPKGKILLSYRKEFDSEISSAAERHQIPKEKVYLSRMNKKGIVEVIKGVSESPNLQPKYNLKIETGLPILIANNLMMDRESPIAPVLQIILAKLWKGQNHNPNPVFTIEAYQKLLKKGILLSDFFQQQILEIREWEKLTGHNAEQSGLVLDILENHTSAYGTAQTQSIGELSKLYQHREDILGQLIAKFQDLYLLTKPSEGQTRLAHDTLAPIVKKEVKDSNRPGQIARKILESKMSDYQNAPTEAILEPISLKLVEQGVDGMRMWIPKERELIEKSRKQRQRNRILRLLSIASLVLLIVFTGLYTFQQKNVQLNRKITELFNQASFEQSNGNPAGALAVIQQAIEQKPHDRSSQMLRHDIYSHNEFYTSEINLKANIDKVVSLPQARQNFILLEGQILGINEQGDTITIINHDTEFNTLTALAEDNLILAGDRDGVTTLWNSQGNLVQTFKHQHNSRVNAVAYAKETGQIATAGGDDRILLYDRAGDFIHKMEDQEAEVLSIALSANGTFLIAGNRAGAIILTNLNNYETTLYEGHTDRILAVAFAPDNQTFASASRDATIRVWDKEKGVIAILRGHSRRINDIAFSPDGNYLLSASDDQSIILWDLEHYTAVKSYLGHQSYVNSISFNPDGEGFLSASSDFTLKSWKIDSKVQQHFDLRPNLISGAAFSNDGSLLLTTVRENPYQDKVNAGTKSSTDAYLWDTESGALVTNLSGHTANLTDAISAKNATLFLTADDDGKAIVWNAKGQKIQTLEGHSEPVNSVHFSEDNERALTASDDGTVIIWDLSTSNPMDTLIGHASFVTAARFLKDNETVVTAGYDSTIIIWSIHGEILNQVRAHSKRITDIALSPDETYLLSASLDNSARLWSIQGNELHLVDEFSNSNSNISGSKAINCVTFSPDSQYFAIASEGGIASVFHIEGQKLQSFRDGGPNGIHALRFSPDSKSIFVGYGDGKGRLYDLLKN